MVRFVWRFLGLFDGFHGYGAVLLFAGLLSRYNTEK